MKKGQVAPLEWLVNILKGALEIVLVVAIVFGIVSVVWRATNVSPQDQDFKRIVDAEDKILEDFNDQKIHSGAYITVPIVSESPLQIAFYPTGGTVAPPQQCRGQTCLCTKYETTGGIKTTCKTVDIKSVCFNKICGKELCSGGYQAFVVSKGDAVKIHIECADQGTQLLVNKV